MLSTAKSANVGFSQVVQLLAPPTNPAYSPRAENSFYKFGKKFLGVNNVRTNITVFCLGLGFRVRVRISLVCFVLVLWTIMWRHLSNQLVDGTSLVFATDPSGRYVASAYL